MNHLLPVALLALGALAGASLRASDTEPISQTIQFIDEALARESRLLRGGGALASVWLNDRSRFLYLENGPGDFQVALVVPESGSVRGLSTDRAVRNTIIAAGRDPASFTTVGLTRDETRLILESGDERWTYDLENQALVHDPALTRQHALQDPQLISDQFPTTFGPLIEVLSPDGSMTITVRDHNLFVRSTVDDSERALTRDGHLLETWLNTQESAQSFNVHWSGDSTRIATIQLDTREVWHEPLPRFLETPPATWPIAYPRAGEPMHRFRPYIIDVSSGARTPIQLGDTQDHYVDLMGWSQDDAAVYVQVIDREQKHLRIFAADPGTGESRPVFEEHNGSYIDTWMTLGIDFFHPLTESDGFLFLSERSGWRHILKVTDDGERVTTLTSGQWPVHDIVAVDERGGHVYFRAPKDMEAPQALQLFRVPLADEAEPQLLTQGDGRNDIAMGPNNLFFLAQRSGPNLPPVVELRRANGTLVRILSRFDDGPLRAAGFGGAESFELQDLSGRWTITGTIFKPFGFDPEKRYAVIEVIYGGMQLNWARHQFYGFGRSGRVDTVSRALLAQGVVLVFVDAPGTPGRGKAYQDAVYGTWPQTVIPNHVHAIEGAAKSRPWMDLERVGVYGHSWGSYMAQRAMIEAPGFYKAAVAHNGGSDFYDQPTYIEPFMGLPESNPRGYEVASNLHRVDAIEGPILVFSGPFDVNSGFSPAFKLVQAMVEARKDVELFVMPGAHHRLWCCSWNEELYKVARATRFLKRELR